MQLISSNCYCELKKDDHQCKKTNIVENVKSIADSILPKQKEQFISLLLKENIQETVSTKKESVSLSLSQLHGKPAKGHVCRT